MDTNGYIFLADFGLSKFLQGETDQTYSFCGTAEYLAPEILDMKGHGFSVDWWTFGILVYEMATGRPPFMHKNHHQLGQMIRKSPIIFPDPVRHKIEMSEDLKDLITRLLDRNPATRLGYSTDVKEILSHPFFQGIDFDALRKKELEAPYVPKEELLTLKEGEFQIDDPLLKEILAEDEMDVIS